MSCYYTSSNPEDYSDKTILRTYQTIVHVGQNGNLYNGTGSIVTVFSSSTAISSSFAEDSDYALSAGYALTSGYSNTSSYLTNNQGFVLSSQTGSMTVFSASYAQNVYISASGQDVTLGNIIVDTVTANQYNVKLISSSVMYSNGSTKFGDTLDDIHTFTGSLEATGSITLNGQLILSTPLSSSYSNTSSYLTNNQGFILSNQTGSFAITGSNIFIGDQTVTGSFNVSGSTTQIGNNTLLGNTTLSGSIIVSGSFDTATPTVKIHGDAEIEGYLRFMPVIADMNASISASYMYMSGSTNDLYFSQNTNGYRSDTRLRWLEGNLYTGLLSGGIISQSSATTFNVSSGSGIVVKMNSSLLQEPYPTVKYCNWGNITDVTSSFLSTHDQIYVGIDENSNLIERNSIWLDGDYNNSIFLGSVIHQDHVKINATITFPSVAYGYKQRTYDFLKAFGALKLSGHSIVVSGSSTGSLMISSGTSFSEGRNYQIDTSNPSYISDGGTTVSKIFRYYNSGSEFIYNTNGGVGYQSIDYNHYNNNGTLTEITGTGNNRKWHNQRVFWFPNSATKGIFVYYGTQTYSSQNDAITNLPYESFYEAENTKNSSIYVGSITLRNDCSFTDTSSYKILPGGLFRNTGGSAGTVGGDSLKLEDLNNVSKTLPVNGDALIYNSSDGLWTPNGSITSSYLINNQGFVLSSQTSSINVLSSSYSTTSSYVQNASDVTIKSGNNINLIGNVIGSNSIQAATFNGDGYNVTGVNYNSLVNVPSQLLYNIPTASLSNLLYYSNTTVNADGLIADSYINAGFKLSSIIASSSTNIIISVGTSSLSNVIVNSETITTNVDELPLGKQFFSNTNSSSLYVSSPSWSGGSVNLVCKYEKIAGDQVSATALCPSVNAYQISTNFTASNNDVALVRTTTGAVNCYLPPSYSNTKIIVKKITNDSYFVNIIPSGSQTIDSSTMKQITAFNSSITIIGDGQNYYIV